MGWGAKDIGTNMPELSLNATRMSSAGIPLFYGSSDATTAIEEVGHADRRPCFTGATFKLSKDITIVDLTLAVEIPSVFDPEHGHRRGELLFLQALIARLREPLSSEDRSQLDYVPTQVFCEYFLRVFEGGVRGIRWKSATTAEGLSVALDIPNADCVEADEVDPSKVQLLRVPNSRVVYRRGDTFFQVP